MNLIASGTLALLEHPKQFERLRDDPTLVSSAVEELLRFSSPVEIATERYATHDLELHGQTIPRGGLVLAVLGSANRDGARFAMPDELDITRAPNPHLAFGQGVHYCLGAPLARLEGQIAIATLLGRYASIRPGSASKKLRWRRGLFIRGTGTLTTRRLRRSGRARVCATQQRLTESFPATSGRKNSSGLNGRGARRSARTPRKRRRPWPAGVSVPATTCALQ